MPPSTADHHSGTGTTPATPFVTPQSQNTAAVGHTWPGDARTSPEVLSWEEGVR